MDYRKECRDALDIFEDYLRAFVCDKMSENFGNKWWRTQVPGLIRKNCSDRLKVEQSKRFPRLAITEPIHYTNLGEIKDVICRKDNFEQVFKPFFGQVTVFSAKIEELIAFRNPASHVRPVFGSEQYEAVIVNCRSVFDAMEVAYPSQFDSWIGREDRLPKNEEEVEEVEVEGFVIVPKCHDNLPRPDYTTFFGRDFERKDILDHLNHPRAWITMIDGIGGVGKTALALNCAEHVRDASLKGESDFEYIIWASAKTDKLTPSGIYQVEPTFTDLSSLARTVLSITGFEDDETENAVTLAKDILSAAKVLLVLDNLETVTDPELYEFLQEIPSPSKVLATTRTRIEGSHKNLRLNVLPHEDALEMIRQLASELDSTELVSVSNKVLAGLIERVGGIPLALRLAAGRIATGLPLASFLDKLETGDAQTDLLEFCFSESWSSLEDESQATLIAIVVCSGEPSEVELRQVTGIPEMRLNDAIGTLIRRGFVNRVYDRNGETYRYSLLPLTADFVEQQSTQYPVLVSQLRDSHSSYLVEKGRFEEALKQASYPAFGSGTMPEAERLSHILVESAFRAYQEGNYERAVSQLENAQRYRDTAHLNHTWGVIERDEGAFGTARAKFRRSVQLDRSRLPTWRSWGRMEQRLQNWREAINCYREATQLPGSDPRDFHGLGVCLSRIVREAPPPDRKDLLAQAEQALRKGFYRNPFGYRETHHNVVNAHALALSLLRLGRTEEALSECQYGLSLEPNNERLINLRLSLTKN